MILALDPATKTGYATSNGEVGTLDLTNAKCKLTALEGFVLKVHSNTPIHLLAYEVASFGAGYRKGKGMQMRTMAFHNELRGVIKKVAHQIGAETLEVHPSSVKAFATGSGRAKKEDMIRAADKLLGLRNLTGDEADAVWIREYAKHREKRPAEFRTPKERKKLAKRTARRQPRLF